MQWTYRSFYWNIKDFLISSIFEPTYLLNGLAPKKETGIGVHRTFKRRVKRLQARSKEGKGDREKENIWQQYRFVSSLELKANIRIHSWFQSDFHLRYQLVMKHNQRYYTRVHDALFVLWLSASLHSGHYTLAGILFIRPLNII